MINENNKHSWCVNAEHAISGNNDGTTKICCMINTNWTPKPVLGETDILDHFNRDTFVDVRQSLSSGVRHSACSNCWNEEDSGRKSKRQRDNEKYVHDLQNGVTAPYEGIVKVELNLGNTCNIKCRTCHPAISSSCFKPYSSSLSKYLNR